MNYFACLGVRRGERVIDGVSGKEQFLLQNVAFSDDVFTPPVGSGVPVCSWKFSRRASVVPSVEISS